MTAIPLALSIEIRERGIIEDLRIIFSIRKIGK